MKEICVMECSLTGLVTRTDVYLQVLSRKCPIQEKIVVGKFEESGSGELYRL